MSIHIIHASHYGSVNDFDVLKAWGQPKETICTI